MHLHLFLPSFYGAVGIPWVHLIIAVLSSKARRHQKVQKHSQILSIRLLGLFNVDFHKSIWSEFYTKFFQKGYRRGLNPDKKPGCISTRWTGGTFLSLSGKLFDSYKHTLQHRLSSVREQELQGLIAHHKRPLCRELISGLRVEKKSTFCFF